MDIHGQHMDIIDFTIFVVRGGGGALSHHPPLPLRTSNVMSMDKKSHSHQKRTSATCRTKRVDATGLAKLQNMALCSRFSFQVVCGRLTHGAKWQDFGGHKLVSLHSVAKTELFEEIASRIAELSAQPIRGTLVGAILGGATDV